MSSRGFLKNIKIRLKKRSMGTELPCKLSPGRKRRGHGLKVCSVPVTLFYFYFFFM